MSNNTVKEYIEKAKSIPPAIYNFAALNIVMFIGFVIKDLTVLYMVGTLVLITLLVAALGKVSQMWESPDELISQNVQDRFKEIQNDFHNFVKLLDVKELESSSVNTIITILLIVYTGSLLNGTIQIFIIVDFLFCLVFLPMETDAFLGKAKELWRSVIGKISYCD